MRVFLFVLCFCCALVFLSAQPGYAVIYKYLDKDGLICFADDLQSIPEQYRGTAKIVSGEADQEKRMQPQSSQATEQPSGKREEASSAAAERLSVQHEESLFGKRALLSAILVVSAVFAFMILGILEGDHKKAVVIARIVIVWGVTIYLLYMHAGDAIRLVRSADSAVEDAKHRSEEKGQKAAKAIKALNELVQEAGQTPSPDSPEAEGSK